MNWSEKIPLTLALITSLVAVEWLAALALGRKVYRLSDTLTNFTAYAVYLIIAALYGYSAYLIFTLIQLNFVITPPALPVWLYLLLLLVAEDFCFYWFHRASHKIGILWASHVTHHSSDQFNLSVGLRQSWIPFLAILFWLPLALLGFKPEHILTAQALSLSYQFLMHTQLVNLPRFWGYLFNSPSHHRVHHGMNAQYLDRNFGGVLILWDKLFGSFASEEEPVQFGISPAPARCEVIFAEFGGFFSWFRSFFPAGKNPHGDRTYSTQKFSYTLGVIFLATALVLLFLAVKNVRWFL